jgi:hypothetical protein
MEPTKDSTENPNAIFLPILLFNVLLPSFASLTAWGELQPALQPGFPSVPA